MTHDLTLRLFLCVSALNILTMIVVGILGIRSANLNISEEYDAQLITEASVLWEILEEDSKNESMAAFKVQSFDAENTTPLLENVEKDSLLDYAQWRAFRVWHKDEIMMHSDNTDAMPPQPVPAGLSTIRIGSDTWRVFGLHDKENGLVVETYENLHNRDLLQRDILLDILAPLVIMLPVLALLFSFGVGFGLKDLRIIASRLAARAPSDLSRIDASDIPAEIKPLAHAINTMLAKLETSLAHEREFIDHAAHELRTPLSALKLQAQLLNKSLKDHEVKAQLDELLASVERTAQLVDQLLLLSRVTQREIVLEPVSVQAALKDTIGMYAVRMADKDIHLTLKESSPLAVQAQADLLRTLIGTILDNAIKYTPRHGDIEIAVEHSPHQVAIALSDSGEGIPESERTRVFDRFYRISGSKQPGSGLGLAIASQIAQLLHAIIRLEKPESGKGLRVVITFPVK